MKKWLSFILTISLLISIGIPVHNQIASAQVEEPPFFYCFSSLDVINQMKVDGNNTVKSYDVENDAMKLTPQAFASANPCKIQLNPPSGCDATADEYPVLSMRVKTATAAESAIKLYWRTQGWADQGRSPYWQSSGTINPAYASTDEWQVITFDLRDQNNQYFTGKIQGLLVPFFSESGLSADNSVWVDYIGFFRSEQDAADYAAENPKVVDLQIGNLMTFNKKSSIGQVSVDGSNTALSYDVTNNALKVSVKEADAANPAKLKISVPEAKRFDVIKSPVLSMRVKLTDTNSAFGKIYWRTQGWVDKNGTASPWWQSSATINPAYSATGRVAGGHL